MSTITALAWIAAAIWATTATTLAIGALIETRRANLEADAWAVHVDQALNLLDPFSTADVLWLHRRGVKG